MTNDETKTRNRRKRPAPPTTPDPIEIAMETAASGKPPGDAALDVLRANAVLLREQIGLARNERFRNRIMAVRDTAIAAMVIVVILVAGAALWTASRTTGLVIQPFSVPPKLAEDGLDGRAVAALFQDELVRLEAATVSARPRTSFRNDWSEAINVEVEAGGLSLTEAYNTLTRWLSQETFVNGGLSKTRDGLELVIRTSDSESVRSRGGSDQPEALVRQAAEQFYRQTQPYRYSRYLESMGQGLPPGPAQQALYDRSRAILTELLDSPSETERLWAYTGLSVARDTSLRDSIRFLEAAAEIDPDHPNIRGNLGTIHLSLGHSEVALGYGRSVAALWSNPRNQVKVSEDRRQRLPLVWAAQRASLQADWREAANLYARALSSGQPGGGNLRDVRMAALIALHEPSALSQLIEQQRLKAAGRADVKDSLLSLRALAAASQDRWVQARTALETFEADVSPTLDHRAKDERISSIWPRLAYARARTGDLAGAQALINATPLDCYLCVRERARIAELAGDRAAADRWSAEALRQGPSLPLAFAERGQMLAARGDLAGAMTFYKEAIERAPRWADPQKDWGDALMAQGDTAGAIAKYRAAAERAPKWGALHLAWGRALEARGRHDQALEKYVEAARLDLSDADRAEVARRLRARGQVG